METELLSLCIEKQREISRMALEAMVCQQDILGCNNKDLYSMFEGLWNCDEFGPPQKEEERVDCLEILRNQTENSQCQLSWNSPLPSMVPSSLEADMASAEDFPTLYGSTQPRKRRSKTTKNKQDLENQRITHIAVERNRRKQMNHYLSQLRALMPDSYVPKGDQASIVGSAINYVKELEQCLQFLGGQKQVMKQNMEGGPWSPFAEFFTFPQYSASSSTRWAESPVGIIDQTAENCSAMADIEVSLVESHASLKIRSKKRPKQLLKMVSGLQSLRLTILHLNVTTADQIVLYSLSLKVEDDCKLSSVDEIANAMNHILGRIHEESLLL